MLYQNLIVFSDGSSSFEFYYKNMNNGVLKILNKDLKFYQKKKKIPKFSNLENTTVSNFYRKKHLK